MNKEYLVLLQEWRALREKVSYCENPFTLVKKFFHDKPTVSIQTDPYDQQRWPEPWELIGENIYCEFTKILAICYTLQLTTRFSHSQLSIYIIRDKKNQMEYPVLFVDNISICYSNENICKQDITSDDCMVLREYQMSQYEKQKKRKD